MRPWEKTGGHRIDDVPELLRRADACDREGLPTLAASLRELAAAARRREERARATADDGSQNRG